MIREGEESQEDNLEIRSDENFTEAWLWILRIFFLISTPHMIQSWASAWTHKLDKLAEQPKSCAGGENSTKN